MGIFFAFLGACLSVLLAVWLDRTGALHGLRDERGKQRKRRTRRRKSVGHRSRVPATEPPVLDGEAPAWRMALTELRDGLRDLLALALMVPAISVLYVVLVTGFFWWLKPLLLAFGVSEQAAESILIADVVLALCSGAWTLTGIGRKRAFEDRVARSAVMVLLSVGVLLVALVPGEPLFGVFAAVLGLWAYLKLFS